MSRLSSIAGLCLLSASFILRLSGQTAAPPVNPLLFVTQVPHTREFSVSAVFGNHLPEPEAAPRGGDLWIRYPNGTLKNLTATAGLGIANGFQGTTGIAVRDPSVHWDGKKAVFSLLVGGASQRYEYPIAGVWQLYEVSGLGSTETPVITRVLNQPAQYNNVSPCYATDDCIIFTSDRPHNGQAHLYPQRDEYEEAPTNTGLWSLNPTNKIQFSISCFFQPEANHLLT